MDWRGSWAFLSLLALSGSGCALILGLEEDNLASGGVATTAGGALGSEGGAGGLASSGGSTNGGAQMGAGGALVSSGGTVAVAAGGGSPSGNGGALAAGGASSSITGGQPNASGGTSGPGTGGAGAGQGGDGGANDAPCAGHELPLMVRVGSYCIDSTEVTNEQYAKFTINPLAPSEVPDCEWKTIWAKPNYISSQSNDPVGMVDWCDAKAYCQWAGKRLCGRIGGGAQPENSSDGVNENLDEWYRVCSDGGKLRFSYGQTYDATKCNSSSGGMKPVASMPECVSAQGRVFDLLGNTWEWVNACTELTSDGKDKVQCEHRGGSCGFDEQSCLAHLTQARTFRVSDIGIRCCSD